MSSQLERAAAAASGVGYILLWSSLPSPENIIIIIKKKERRRRKLRTQHKKRHGQGTQRATQRCRGSVLRIALLPTTTLIAKFATDCHVKRRRKSLAIVSSTWITNERYRHSCRPRCSLKAMGVFIGFERFFCVLSQCYLAAGQKKANAWHWQTVVADGQHRSLKRPSLLPTNFSPSRTRLDNLGGTKEKSQNACYN